MDISAIIVVLVLIVLFFGGVVWMEVHARKTGSKIPPEDAKNSESNETDLEQYSPFFPLRTDRTVLSKKGAEEK
jgi:hypothetical protein